jgi:hypothetical protein
MAQALEKLNEEIKRHVCVCQQPYHPHTCVAVVSRPENGYSGQSSTGLTDCELPPAAGDSLVQFRTAFLLPSIDTQP